MKLVKHFETENEEYIDLEETDLDGEAILVVNADGYGACDIEMQCGTITWKQLDKLKKAIDFAEVCWRGI